MEKQNCEKLNSQASSLTKKNIVSFLETGFFKIIKSKRSYEIEAKVKQVCSSFLQEKQFEDCFSQLSNVLRNDTSLVKQSQFLLSFNFEDDFRLTYHSGQQKFILEIKDKNTPENTTQFETCGGSLNVSKKQETVVDKESLINYYIDKVAKMEFQTVRVKARKTLTTENFIQRCFSRVIQIHNTPSPNQPFKKASVAPIWNKIFIFCQSRSYHNANKVATHCFHQDINNLLRYEIEIEAINIKNIFNMEKISKQQINSHVIIFLQSIEQIMSLLQSPKKSIKEIGNYSDEAMNLQGQPQVGEPVKKGDCNV